MKCDKCFFCIRIGAGIHADYPVKYCRHTKQYKTPFVTTFEDGKPVTRRLDLSNMSDCKIWREVGCNIHPSTVMKAKKIFLMSMEKESKKKYGKELSDL